MTKLTNLCDADAAPGPDAGPNASPDAGPSYSPVYFGSCVLNLNLNLKKKFNFNLETSIHLESMKGKGGKNKHGFRPHGLGSLSLPKNKLPALPKQPFL